MEILVLVFPFPLKKVNILLSKLIGLKDKFNLPGRSKARIFLATTILGNILHS